MHTIPDNLLENLPDMDLTAATITNYRDLCNAHDVEGGDVDDDAVVVIAPGYIADDGNAEVEYPSADSASAAAQEYVDDGSWGDVIEETSWIRVHVWRLGYAIDEYGDLARLVIDHDSRTVALEPDEPECDSDDDHDWQSPYDVLGGIKENPGVWGHGGGAIVREVCSYCGRYRVTDTWAQDPDTGEQGLTSVRYEDADEVSERWVAASTSEN